MGCCLSLFDVSIPKRKNDTKEIRPLYISSYYQSSTIEPYKIHNQPPTISTTKVTCDKCGKKFTRNISDTWRNCCSKECSDLILVTKQCTKCNMPFTVTKKENYKKLCGRSSCFQQQQKKGYSSKAIVWLESIAQKEGIHIQHAENGGEYIIQNEGGKFFKMDGYCKETNTVYEFYGDFWHGNPKIYESSDYNEKAKKTYGELYSTTLWREGIIKGKGYNFVSIWESEYDRL